MITNYSTCLFSHYYELQYTSTWLLLRTTVYIYLHIITNNSMCLLGYYYELHYTPTYLLLRTTVYIYLRIITNYIIRLLTYYYELQYTSTYLLIRTTVYVYLLINTNYSIRLLTYQCDWHSPVTPTFLGRVARADEIALKVGTLWPCTRIYVWIITTVTPIPRLKYIIKYNYSQVCSCGHLY